MLAHHWTIPGQDDATVYCDASHGGKYCLINADVNDLLALPYANEPVTRFEVIDHTTNADPTGRIVVKRGVSVRLSYQDDGRTLKVFLGDMK